MSYSKDRYQPLPSFHRPLASLDRYEKDFVDSLSEEQRRLALNYLHSLFSSQDSTSVKDSLFKVLTELSVNSYTPNLHVPNMIVESVQRHESIEEFLFFKTCSSPDHYDLSEQLDTDEMLKYISECRNTHTRKLKFVHVYEKQVAMNDLIDDSLCTRVSETNNLFESGQYSLLLKGDERFKGF